MKVLPKQILSAWGSGASLDCGSDEREVWDEMVGKGYNNHRMG